MSGTRRGMVSPLMIAIALMGIVVVLLEGAVYVNLVSNGISASGGTMYSGSMIDEAILNAPCATHRRGVFYRSAVESGDFRCVEPPVSARITVVMDSGTRHSYDLVRTDSGLSVVEGHTVRQHSVSRGYPVLVYDRGSGSYTNATLLLDARGIYS